MDLYKLNIILVSVFCFLSLFTLAGSSLTVLNIDSCSDSQPSDPTPGCHYDQLQAIAFIVTGVMGLAFSPLGFLVKAILFIVPAFFAGLSIIINIVYMLNYRTNNNWKFQTSASRQKVWSQQLHFLAESGTLILLCFLLYLFGKYRREQNKEELEQAQRPQTITVDFTQSTLYRNREEQSRKNRPHIHIERSSSLNLSSPKYG